MLVAGLALLFAVLHEQAGSPGVSLFTEHSERSDMSSLESALRVEAVEHRYIVECTHGGCHALASYHVHTRDGQHIVPRCFTHLKEDFGVDRINPVHHDGLRGLLDRLPET